jgi:DNA sulfur modification protein DndD
MRIKKLENHYFRVYGANVELHFDFKPNRPLVFLGGQNGFGKSTFITSILWCLYGKLIVHVDPYYERMVRSAGGYSKFTASNCNRSIRSAYYFVELTLEDVELPAITCRELVIRRSWSDGKEQLEILLDGSPNDLVDSLGFELFIQEYILPKEVARFFLFDAERITSLAESRGAEERRELGNAYEKVLGVRRFVEIQNQLLAIRERVLSVSGDQLVRQKLSDCQKKSEAALAKVDEWVTRNARIEDLLISAQAQRDERALELLSLGFVGDSKDIEDLQNQEADFKRQIAEATGAFKGFLDILPLLLSPTWLEVVRIESVKVGKGIDSALTKEIALKAANWIQENGGSNALAHGLQSHLEGLAETLGSYSDIPLPDALERQGWEARLGWLKDWMSQTHLTIKRDRSSLKRIQTKLGKLNASGSNEDAASVREQVMELDRKLEEYRGEKARNEVYIEQSRRDISIYEKQKSELLKSIEVDKRNESKERVLRQVADKLELFVSAFKEQRRINLERRICDALKQMLHKEHLLDEVEIEFDDSGMDLRLLNSSGQEIVKDDLSMGEKQLYAIALLKALIDESGMSFPVVIDSPLQKLDKEHAFTLLETILPNLSDQVFILPIPVKEFSELEYHAIKARVHSLHLIEHDASSSNIKTCSAAEFFAQQKVEA